MLLSEITDYSDCYIGFSFVFEMIKLEKNVFSKTLNILGIWLSETSSAPLR